MTSKKEAIGELDFLWVELTNACNLRCAHCYAGSSPNLPITEAMDVNDWKRVLAEARVLGCRALQFIGGEPTIHPHFLELVKDAEKKGFDLIEVFTNASTLKKDQLDTLRKCGAQIATSFYSPTPSVHDKITQTSGSFDRTIKGIKAILHEGIPIRAEIISMSENSGQTSEAVKYLEQLGVTKVAVHRTQHVGRAAENAYQKSTPYGDICGQCWKGRLAVNASGETYPCIMARTYATGNAKRDSLDSIVRSERLRSFREDVRHRFTPPGGIPGFDLDDGLPFACAPGGWTDPCAPGTVPDGLRCAPSRNLDNCGPVVCAPLVSGTCGPENCGPYDCPPTGVNCGPNNCAPYDCAPTGVVCGPNNLDHND